MFSLLRMLLLSLYSSLCDFSIITELMRVTRTQGGSLKSNIVLPPCSVYNSLGCQSTGPENVFLERLKHTARALLPDSLSVLLSFLWKIGFLPSAV